MNATAKNNRLAIFGDTTTTRRRCSISGRLSRRIAGEVAVYDGNLCHLWVWTAQARRVTQDVVARIDLSAADALDQLRAAGVELV